MDFEEKIQVPEECQQTSDNESQQVVYEVPVETPCQEVSQDTPEDSEETPEDIEQN